MYLRLNLGTDRFAERQHLQYPEKQPSAVQRRYGEQIEYAQIHGNDRKQVQKIPPCHWLVRHFRNGRSHADGSGQVGKSEPSGNDPLQRIKHHFDGGYATPEARPYNVPGGRLQRFRLKIHVAERNALRLRWDTYEEIGAPEIKDFDDLIDVMEQMQKARPTAEDGTPCFGTILNNGSDSSFWACMVLWYRWQGYFEHQLPYLLEADMYNGEYHSILDKDSLYYKGLKWYNKVYRRGLMDPDSINNDRPTQKVKVDGGYAQIPSGYLPGWAPTYLEYHIPGTKVFYAPVTTYGDSRYLIGINANTKNVEACLAYLDMLADPEAYLNIIQGPDGEFWYSDDQGNAYLTEAGTKWFEDGHNDSSGFTLSNGETLEMWNSPFLARNGTLTRFGEGKGGYRTASILGWTEFSEIGTSSKVFDQWRATTGHENWKEWLGDDYSSDSPLQDVFSFTSLPDDNMQLMIDAIKDKVTTASWKMVYSSSDSEFDTLWDQMVADCNGLDANSIIEWRLADLENAKQIRDSL